jgi:hypothetical protein
VVATHLFADVIAFEIHDVARVRIVIKIYFNFQMISVVLCSVVLLLISCIFFFLSKQWALQYIKYYAHDAEKGEHR